MGVDDIKDYIAGIEMLRPAPYAAGVVLVLVWAVSNKKQPVRGAIASCVAACGFFLAFSVGVATTGVAFGYKAWHAADTKAGKRRSWIVGMLIPWAVVIPTMVWANPDRAKEVAPLLGVMAVAVAVVAAFVLFRRRRPTAKDDVRFFPSDMRQEVIRRDGNSCRYCGADGDALGVELQMDHIHPWSKGGPTNVANAQLLCSPCNRMKSDLSDDAARKKFKKVHGRSPLPARR